MAPRSILIVGNYGAGNLGDDAILGGIVTELHNLGYKGEIQVTHGGVQSSSEIYKGLKKVPFIPVGLRSRFKKSRREAWAAVKRADCIILGGGGLFMDEESWKAPIIWAAQAKACWKLEKPYLCFGQSIGPLKHFWSRRLTKQVFKRAKAVHVRDEDSAKLLKGWGIEASVGTDPAFSWLLQEKRKIPRKPVLLVSLRSWPGFSDFSPLVKEIQVFAKRKNLKPILLSTDLREKKLESPWEWYQPNSALAAFEAIAKAEIAVTMRLHAGIFALASGTPLIALSYSKKVQNLFTKLDIKGSFALLKALNPVDLREELKNLDKKPVTCNLEKPLVENQAFLAHHLADIS